MPNGWFLCDGATYECKDYPQLFRVIGDTWSEDNDKTFKVLSFRGIFLRGFDDDRDLDQNRQFAYEQKGSIKSYTHICTMKEAGEYRHNF